MLPRTLLLLLLVGSLLAQAPAQYSIGGIFEFTSTDVQTGELFSSNVVLRSFYSAFMLAVNDINDSDDILPGTTLVPIVYDGESTVSGSLSALVEADATGLSAVIGPSYSEQSLIAAVASGVYNILLASPSASAASLSDSALYPLFVRSVPPDTKQGDIMADLIEFYYNATLVENWKQIGVISTADDYGVGGAKDFIDTAAARGFQAVAFQQFLVGATEVEVEVRELQNSGARVFVSFMRAPGYQTMIAEANRQDIIGPFYVWICSDGCSTSLSFSDLTTGDIIPSFAKLSVGYQGVLPRDGTGPNYDAFLQRWLQLDPDEFPGAGEKPALYALTAYEMTYAVALAINDQFEKGNYKPTGEDLFNSTVALEFEGLTGPVIFESNGDRQSRFEVVNLLPNYEYQTTFTWDVDAGLQQLEDTYWRTGKTEIPDLDVLPEFDYWSCHDKESGTDITGKTINLRQPDGDDINYIKASYECDQFIDCENMSDEAYQCTPSFVIAFIVVGIITGLLVLGSIWCVPLVCIFGCCVRRHRIFLSGTVFLVIMILSCVVGFISTYAWYGKPHTVACNFQLWLFGLSASSLAAALFAKQFRFFRSTAGTGFIRKITKSDQKGASNPINPELEFFLIWVILMLFPLLICILWTAVSTPEASMKEVDDLDHYICQTGGVTGEPGGLVWFFILVAYDALMLFLTLLLGFFVRHVPRPFMDKRLMSISAFNLGFLTAVVIPVFLVLRYISPFAAWMVRTLGILYGFSSTLLIHMVPKLIGLVLIDRFQSNSGAGKGSGPTLRTGGVADTASMSASQSAS